jgi:hypothetical protein
LIWGSSNKQALLPVIPPAYLLSTPLIRNSAAATERTAAEIWNKYDGEEPDNS